MWLAIGAAWACDRLGCAESARDGQGCCPVAAVSAAPAPDALSPEAEAALRQKRVEAIARLDALLQRPQPPTVEPELRLRKADLLAQLGHDLVAHGDPSGAESLRRATDELRRILSEHPSYARTDHATFLDAKCRAELGEHAAARASLEGFAQRFPGSMFVGEAAEQLALLP